MVGSVKRAFMLSAAAAKVFCIIVVFNIAVNVINLSIMPAPIKTEMSTAKSFTVVGVSVLFFLAAVFIQGGIIAYIKELVKSGSANLASFVGNSAKYFLRMLAIVLITILVVLGWGVLFFGMLPIFLPSLKVLFAILGLIFLIGMIILLILPAYALVGGDLGAMAAIRKSVSMTISNFLQVIGILAVLVLIGIVVMFAASLMIGLLTIPFKQSSGYIAAVAMAISSAIVTLLADIAYMDFYLKKS
jgi:hypothetical protein